MKGEHENDWDPRSEQVRQDQRASYDAMRKKCPVAHSEFFGWSLFRHGDVMRALIDHETFSNKVSQHASVPNGMDPPEHTEYRKIIEPYFSAAKMSAFEPICRTICRDLAKQLPRETEVEFMEAIALPFAVRVQCAFLGWPESLHETLVNWLARNQAATLAQDRAALAAIAAEFDGIINDLIATRKNAPASQDVTSSLMHEKVAGRPLKDEELSSILRNWTAGEIGTISAAVGIVAHFLADHPDLQRILRADPGKLPYAIDEILRIYGPLVANRRVTTKPIEIGGRKIGKGERISINWVSANRDEAVFEKPEEFQFGRDPSKNLLYGAGIHVCPGAPLASLEMRVFMEELLAATTMIAAAAEPSHAVYPGSGFAKVMLRFT
jgi:cytochrome P450